jgi:hypothetical protein
MPIVSMFAKYGIAQDLSMLSKFFCFRLEEEGKLVLFMMAYLVHCLCFEDADKIIRCKCTRSTSC